jgi:hypothetical protein
MNNFPKVTSHEAAGLAHGPGGLAHGPGDLARVIFLC